MKCAAGLIVHALDCPQELREQEVGSGAMGHTGQTWGKCGLMLYSVNRQGCRVKTFVCCPHVRCWSCTAMRMARGSGTGHHTTLCPLHGTRLPAALDVYTHMHGERQWASNTQRTRHGCGHRSGRRRSICSETAPATHTHTHTHTSGQGQ